MPSQAGRLRLLRIPVRGLSEFRCVLRPGGRVAVSVNPSSKRSYNHQINAIIARHLPSLAEAVTRTFALGEASLLVAGSFCRHSHRARCRSCNHSSTDGGIRKPVSRSISRKLLMRQISGRGAGEAMPRFCRLPCGRTVDLDQGLSCRPGPVSRSPAFLERAGWREGRSPAILTAGGRLAPHGLRRPPPATLPWRADVRTEHVTAGGCAD